MTTTTSLVGLSRTILGSLTTTFTAPTSCAYLGVAYVGNDLVGWEGQVRPTSRHHDPSSSPGGRVLHPGAHTCLIHPSLLLTHADAHAHYRNATAAATTASWTTRPAGRGRPPAPPTRTRPSRAGASTPRAWRARRATAARARRRRAARRTGRCSSRWRRARPPWGAARRE